MHYQAYSESGFTFGFALTLFKHWTSKNQRCRFSDVWWHCAQSTCATKRDFCFFFRIFIFFSFALKIAPQFHPKRNSRSGGNEPERFQI